MPRKITRELLDGFLVEVQDSLVTIGELLQSLMETWDEAALQEAHRLAHSVKGAALMVRFPSIHLLSKWLEETLEDGMTDESEGVREMLLPVAFGLWELLTAFSEGITSRTVQEEQWVTEGAELYQGYFSERDTEDWETLPQSIAESLNSESLGILLKDESEGQTNPMPTEPPKSDGDEIPSSILEEVDRDLAERESAPAELLEVFNEEADDHLKILYRTLEEIENSEPRRELVQEIRRSAHTLKGAAGVVGLKTISRISHRMEDLLDQLYERDIAPNAEQIRLIYRTTDALDDLARGEFEPSSIRLTIGKLYVAYDRELANFTDAPETEPLAEQEATAAVEVAPTVPQPQQKETPAKPVAASVESVHQGPGLRVPLERIDEVSRLVGELIINRSSLEQRMNSFHNYVEELQISLDRLRRIASELETHYEVEALGGRWDRGRPAPGGESSKWKPVMPNASSLRVSKNRLDEFDELEFDQYTEFHLLARSLSEVTSDVGTLGHELKNLTGDFDSLLTRQSRLAREAQDRLTRVRMVPLATIADRLKRTIRGVAEPTGKTIQLSLEGEQVELDKTTLEDLAEPLMHLLRNAADHGVENPEERRSFGKPETATVSVRGFTQGTHVLLEIADDGRGIDAAAIRAKAVELGMIAPEDAENLNDDSALQLIFEPGLTTAAELTEVSGRGVGMDIVREKLRKLKGTIGIQSTVGVGTTFTIKLPMTQAITRALLVKVEQQTFAVPMQAVVQILRVDPNAAERVGGVPVLQVAGETYPLHRLANRLGVPSAAGWDASEMKTMLPVMILGAGKSKVGFQINGILGARDIVVKTLGSHLGNVKGILGATLLGDGTVVPILDPLVLVGEKEEEATPAIPVRPVANRQAKSADRPLNVLVADDSVSVRRVMTNLVKSVGWNPIPAKDGRDALEILHGLPAPPDIFLLDIEMPRMDGYELLGFLRSQEAYRQTPVVMVTSRAGEKHRQKAMDLGASGYLVKPYQDDELLNLVRELVARPKTGGPAKLLV